MVEENRRRFSLDEVKIDPRLKNRILSADGDDEVGTWNGEKIKDLVEELDRIEEKVDANYAGLPHNGNIPEDLRNQVEKDLPIWACDKAGNCLVGDDATKIRSVEQIRDHYEKKYGGIEKFKEKLCRDREEMIKRLNK